VTLSYTDEGQGPVVVTVSGLPGAHHHWRWLSTPLFDWARVVRLELPGFGEARLPGRVRPLSLQARGELVARALEALDLREVMLVGHSMGGVISLEVATHHRARVRALTLVASPGPTAHFPVPLWRSGARVLMTPFLGRPLSQLARAAYRRFGFSVRDMTDEGALRTVVDAAFMDFRRHAENLRAVTVPVLHTFAEDDALVPLESHLALARTRPDFTQLRFAEGGHDVQKFHGIEVAAAIRQLGERASVSSPPAA
jgi:pimeloyl-ACP methyl ester carboxylesterase